MKLDQVKSSGKVSPYWGSSSTYMEKATCPKKRFKAKPFKPSEIFAPPTTNARNTLISYFRHNLQEHNYEISKF